VLTYDAVETVTDDEGQPMTRWDGRTFKQHPITGEQVPDDTARVPLPRFVNARRAEWPPADFIIGNPPYVGARRIRLTLGDEYVETLRAAYPEVPETSDYVMFWWHKAATEIGRGAARRFGFITTNSIVQSYSRGLIEEHLNSKQGVRIVFAIPDHPWVEASDGAAVRVAMTVAASRADHTGSAALLRVLDEDGEQVTLEQSNVPFISASLRSTLESQSIEALQANGGMCFQGVVPAGDGFKLETGELAALGFNENNLPPVIRKYIIGRDLVQRHQPKYIIDFFGMSEVDARAQWPALYQRLLDHVYPERRENKRAAYRDRWWIFAEPRPAMRRALMGLPRFVVTSCTAKHRAFIFVNGDYLPDTTVYAVASDDAYSLGVLSSHIHTTWALSSGGTLEDRPRYTSKDTFVPFPFPDCTERQQARIREVGEALDTHRKSQQAKHSDLTLTEMYNVLEKLRVGEQLSERERATHERGLVSVLRQIHDDLDAAVADAYGWPAALSNEEILERLMRLNTERATEERGGLVRWLRPEYQRPAAGIAAGFGEGFEAAAPAKAKEKKQEWPKTLPEQARALRQMLAAQPGVVTPEQIAKKFMRARIERVEELLQTLVSLGQAREVEAGRFTA
jgi:hypothetical protein